MDGIVVLISGRGSNLAAICKNGLTSQIKCVISNKAAALGLNIAKEYNIPTEVIDHKLYNDRTEFDQALASIIDKHNPKLVVLAGFMRILSPYFVNHYLNRLINIHPSLLPSFIGINAQEQAISEKVKVSGATVHFVTEQLDHGPIIAQGVVKILPNDTPDSLSQRILEIEHTIYPFAISKILKNHTKIIDQKYVEVIYDENDSSILGKYQSQIYY
jgi:phosphoribosylglycinamide formyltransferase-1